MDHHGTMKTRDSLRDLFAEAGPAQAADGLEAVVFARLVAKPVVKRMPEPSLIPRWAWGIAAGLVAALFIEPQASSFTWKLPSLPNMAMTSTMRWTLAALACGALLFALDSVLRTRATTPRAI